MRVSVLRYPSVLLCFDSSLEMTLCMCSSVYSDLVLVCWCLPSLGVSIDVTSAELKVQVEQSSIEK